MAILDAIVGAVLRAGLTWLGRKRLPLVDGRLSVPGLSDEVEIIRDRWGVPHIYAGSERDLYFAQGFVHAQDRLWQMELSRRAGSGRLSELFGALTLETDRLVRTLGFRRIAEIDWDRADRASREALEAYAAGVNAHIEHPSGRTPVEFTLLRRSPEPWCPVDSLSSARLTTWALSFGWYSELVRAQVAERVGGARAADLEIEYPPGNSITLPHGVEFNLLSHGGLLEAAKGPFLHGAGGSNAWVVSAARSETGSAILANDPHLPLRIPAIWYENHLAGGEVHVTGASLPGLPGVVIGHNENIAWGVTVAFTDCQDLFIERFDHARPERYLAGDEWVEADVVEEEILVRGRSVPHVERVLSTRHGPVLPQAGGSDQERLALSASSLRPSPDFGGWLGLNKARNWNDFVIATREIRGAQLNIVYADVEGNIGYRVTGTVPVRAKGLGLVPSPGWTGEYEWVGEIPFEEMPHALNPQRGYLVTANNRVAGEEYPHYLGSIWTNGYRATHIEAELERLTTIGIGDCRQLQMDFSSLPGRLFVQLLEGFETDDADARLALTLLRSWDGQLGPDSAGGAVYEVARYTTLRNLLEPVLGPGLATKIMGGGLEPLISPESEYVGNDTIILFRLIGEASSKPSWWVERAGGRDALLARSLAESARWLRGRLGDDPARWRWGNLHAARFGHALGMRKPLDRVFDRGPFPVGGDADTLCQFAFSPGDPYGANSNAPSYRQIIDLGDLSRSVAVLAPGQSGQIGSRHYDDMIAPWLAGEYHPMLWTREQVERAAEAKLTLTPPGPGVVDRSQGSS